MQDEIREQLLAFLPRLRRFAYALTGSLDRGDDLVQDTIERVLMHWSKFEPGTRFDSWTFKIAQNLWFNQRRSSAVRREIYDLEAAADIPGSDGRDVTENRLMLRAVQQGMAALPVDQRAVMTLVCVDGLSYKDAAEVLDVPIGTVMSRLARARRSLFERLGPEFTFVGGDAKAERRNG